MFLLCGSVIFAAESKPNAAPRGYVPKTSLAEQVLKVVISGKYRKEYEHFKEVPLEKMPNACQEDCISAKEIYGNDVKTASVTYIDLDSDGNAEMIVTYRHYWGNGVRSYDILSKRNGEWVKSHEFHAVFWQPLKIGGKVGLFLDNKCGWTQRNYSFCEFKEGKLVPLVSIDLERYHNKEDHRLTIQVKSKDEAEFTYLF